MRILVFGEDETKVKHAEWSLLALGTDYQIETTTVEDALDRWPLSGIGVGVIVAGKDDRFVEEFFMRCPRTPYSPVMVCVGDRSRASTAALLELGADDFITSDEIEHLGPTKIKVLLRRERVLVKAGKRAPQPVGGRRKPATVRLPLVAQQPSLRRAG